MAALLGLALLVTALFHRLVFLGEALYERDLGFWYYPQVESIVRIVASGSWPLWDPYMAFGVPLLANPSAQILYPPTALHLLMEPWTFYTVYVVGHLVFTGAGQYLLARRLGLTGLASLVAASAWTASGPLLSLVNMWHHFAGACWIPWLLFAAERARASLRTRDCLLFAAAIGGQILAGSADMCAIAVLGTLPAVLRPVTASPPEGASTGRWLKRVATAWALAASLTAVQWLPSLDLIRGTQRTGLVEAVRTDWSVHPLGLLQVAAPVFTWGVPFATGDARVDQEARSPLLYSLYASAGVLGFAAWGIAASRRALRWFFVLLLVGVPLVALGRHGPFYGALVALLPPLEIIRFPVKSMLLVPFACSMLAGMGFDAWSRAEAAARRRSLMCFGLAAGLCGLIGAAALAASRGLLQLPIPAEPWLPDFLPATAARVLFAGAVALALGLVVRGSPRTPRLAAAAALAVGELALANSDINPSAPRELLARRPATVAAIAADGAPRPTRIYTFDYFSRVVGKRYPEPEVRAALDKTDGRGPRGLFRTLGMRMLFPASGRWALESSFDRDNLGLTPTHKRALLTAFRVSEETPHFARLLAMSSVNYVLALHAEGLEDLSEVARVSSPFRLPIRVFRVRDPLPLVYVVGRGRVLDPRAPVYDSLVSGFEPRREVLLTEGPALDSDAFSGSASVRERRPDRILIETDLDKPGYVVLTDSYDAGWRASVDGRPAPVLRANIAFRAVPVPAGRHEVEQVYRPPAVLVGVLVSALAGLVALGLWCRGPAPPSPERPPTIRL